MQATSKLRSLRKLKTRDQPPNHSPTMSSSAAARDLQMIAKRSSRTANASAVDNSYVYSDLMPLSLRRNSSCEIPIPQFMIPSSASSLMDKHYALSPPSTAAPSFGDDEHRTAIPMRQ